METANFSAATSLIRDELVEKAISDRTHLTANEVELLKNRFWAPSITRQERSRLFNAFRKTSKEGIAEYYSAIEAATAAGEQQAAFVVGVNEAARRASGVKEAKLEATASVTLFDAKE